MPYRPKPFARQWYQFKHQAEILNAALANGTFAQWSAQKQERVTSKLIRAYSRLKAYFSPMMLRRVLAGAAMVLGLHTAGQAQNFAPPALNPFNLAMPSGEYFANPTLIDLDGDGDLDLISDHFDYYTAGFYYFENIGSATSPIFANPVQNPFNLSPLPTYAYQFSTLGDLDGDGDYDLVGMRYMGTMYYYENVGTAQQPSFAAPQLNPFTFPGSPAIGDSMYLFPELADMDNDGDMDLFVGNLYNAKVRYFENTGTASSPLFPAGVSMPFNMPYTTYLYITNLSTGDIDRDGDLDVMVSARYDAYGMGGAVNYENRFYYFENIGTATAPDFDPITHVNPFGLESVGYSLLFSDLADIDGDGDLDILAGASDTLPGSYYYAANFFYFENISFGVGREALSSATFNVFPNPTRHVLHISLPEPESYQTEIFDATGRRVYQEMLAGTTTFHTINTATLAVGTYFIRLRHNEHVLTTTFVKH